jgi:hypothetical protein
MIILENSRQPNRITSYQEWWRGWPDETRQPVFFINTTVPIPAMETLIDERGNGQK